MNDFFKNSDHKLVFGLIHLKPLIGTPYYEPGNYQSSIEKAVADAKALAAGGADGCLIQTVDRIYPYTDTTDPIRVACVAIIAHEVRRAVGKDFKIGVQLLWNCITPSLAVTKAADADFIRCTSFYKTIETTYGTLTPEPYHIREYQRKIDALNISITSELAGYHFKFNGTDADIDEKVRDSIKLGIDAVEIYDPNEKVNEHISQYVKERFPEMAVVIGGGTNSQNVAKRLRYADAAFVGGCLQRAGWGSDIDQEKVKEYVNAVRAM